MHVCDGCFVPADFPASWCGMETTAVNVHTPCDACMCVSGGGMVGIGYTLSGADAGLFTWGANQDIVQ